MTPEANSGEVTISYEQKLTLSTAKEETFVVREKDWTRLRRQLKSTQQHRREFSAIAWASIGFAASAVLSGISWAPAYKALAPEQRPEFAWVWPALIALGILGLVLGAAMFWASHVTKGSEAATIGQILEDMDDIRDVKKALSAEENTK